MNTNKLYRDERRAYRIFIASLAAVIFVLFAGIFLGIALRNATLVQDIILERGKSLFEQIVLTRRWAAQYGGVYVIKGPGVASNPWLEHPDLQASDGQMLTLRNPALMTREISEIAARGADYQFRITSLKPLNPGNAPDAFERRSLEAFESGATERYEIDDGPNGRQFRYMGALKTEASCLSCHAKQGYHEGDVRGGISVSFSVGHIEQSLRTTLLIIIVSAIIISALTLATVFAFVVRLRRQLDRTRAELESAATVDALTLLYNRRYLMDRLRQEIGKAIRTGDDLSLAILDADDFKEVNDRHGHVTGDHVLRSIADAICATVRTYDIVARYGGEEFVVVLPGVSLEASRAACDRMRMAIADATAAVMPDARRVTVSIGIAGLSASLRSASASEPDQQHVALEANAREEAIIDAMLQAADSALYRAKDGGKDRCVAAEQG